MFEGVVRPGHGSALPNTTRTYALISCARGNLLLSQPPGTPRVYDLLLFLEDETVSLLNPRETCRNSGRDESMVRVAPYSSSSTKSLLRSIKLQEPDLPSPV